VREDAVSTQTTVMGNMDSLTTSAIHLTNAATNDIVLEIGAGTITFADVLVGKAVGMQVAIRIYRDEDDLISCEVDGFPAGTAQTLTGTLTINSFGKGATNQLLNTDSALQGVEITDSSGRLWDFPLTDNNGTAIENASTATNTLVWLTNSAIYSNLMDNDTSPPVVSDRQGIVFTSAWETGYSLNPNFNSTNVTVDKWTRKIPLDNTGHPIDLEVGVRSDFLTGDQATGASTPEPLVGTYMMRAYWDRSWVLTGTANDKIRSEVQSPGGGTTQFFNLGEEYWQGFAIYIPPEMEDASNHTLINSRCIQWHDVGVTSNKGFHLVSATTGGTVYWKIGFGPYGETLLSADNAAQGIKQAPVEFGRWNKFVLHCKLGPGTEGFAKIWLNAVNESDTDNLIFSKTGGTWNYQLHPQMGIYRGADLTTFGTQQFINYFYDEFRIGKASLGANFASVLPVGVN